MFVNSVLVAPRGLDTPMTWASREYLSDDCIGECVGETLRCAKKLGLDISQPDLLRQQNIRICFTKSPIA